MISPLIILVSFFSSSISLLIQRKHLLISLLSLEAIILSLACLIIFSIGRITQWDPFLFIIILTFGACEARLGLSLLVVTTRSIGSDIVNSLTSSKC